jgi:serine/threonine protein kinase
MLRRRLIRRLAVVPDPLGEVAPASDGTPITMSPADELARLHDLLEQRSVAGEDSNEVLEAIRQLRRQIRNGPTLEPGDILAGRYRLVDEAGKGGFATVWRAWDRRTTRIVAVKVLHGQWGKDRSRIERFVSGARRMSAIQHEAVISVYGEPQQDEHHLFFVMPWLAGGNLRGVVTASEFDRHVALAAVARAARGLAHVHEQRVIHRDVKPENILLDERQRGHIGDFDLAWARDSTHGTTGGLGTFVYAAPEQHQNAGEVDERADVYGVGMCALFVLTGRDPPPFVSRVEPEFFDDLECSALLREVLQTAVAYEAEERTVTCEQVATAIEQEQSGSQPDGPPQSTQTGRILNDRYEIRSRLGKDSMSTCYLSAHTMRGELVALKILHPKYARRRTLRDRFVREVRALSLIKHENLIGISDVGDTPDGSVYLAMEYLQGEVLSETLSSNGRLPWSRVMPITLQICWALGALHDAGIIHYDMKPANCYRIKRGENADFVKIFDVGITKIVSDEFGTPSYVAPERVRGESLDHRVDIYAVGVSMYELLTGRLPFRNLNEIMIRAPRPPSVVAPDARISPEVDAIVLRAMKQDPKLRFSSMAEMAAAIEAVGS